MSHGPSLLALCRAFLSRTLSRQTESILNFTRQDHPDEILQSTLMSGCRAGYEANMLQQSADAPAKPSFSACVPGRVGEHHEAAAAGHLLQPLLQIARSPEEMQIDVVLHSNSASRKMLGHLAKGISYISHAYGHRCSCSTSGMPWTALMINMYGRSEFPPPQWRSILA